MKTDMQPRGLTQAVTHFTEVLPRRAFEEVCSEHEGMNREIAGLQGINDFTLLERLQPFVDLEAEVRSSIEQTMRMHGMREDDEKLIDHLDVFYRDFNPITQHVRDLVSQCLRLNRAS